MPYYNYHGTIKKLIEEDKLNGYYFTLKHNKISPALVLIFNDIKHPIMPIRQEKWHKYTNYILNKPCLQFKDLY